jgi:hypothetical protein
MENSQCFIFAGWMVTLKKHDAEMSALLPRMWDAHALGLNAFVRGDEKILSLKPIIKECHALLLTMRPPSLTNEDDGRLHPFLEDVVSSALATGGDGWVERGFSTSAMRIVNCIALLVRVLTTLFEMQATVSFPYMTGPNNEWIRGLFRIPGSQKEQGPA